MSEVSLYHSFKIYSIPSCASFRQIISSSDHSDPQGISVSPELGDGVGSGVGVGVGSGVGVGVGRG